MNEKKKEVLEEVLMEMDQRINYGLLETSFQNREDLKQEIITKLAEAVEHMDLIPLSEFEREVTEQKKARNQGF